MRPLTNVGLEVTDLSVTRLACHTTFYFARSLFHELNLRPVLRVFPERLGVNYLLTSLKVVFNTERSGPDESSRPTRMPVLPTINYNLMNRSDVWSLVFFGR